MASRITKFHGAALTAACAGALIACGSASAAGTVASVAKLVPASVKSAGVLTVASDATYAPDEFIAGNGKTVVGMDADLSNALGKVMGLKVKITNVTFDDILPGMAAGKFLMGASSFTDTKLREKTVNFVDYALVGESFYTKVQGGTSIKGIADICGLTVSVETGTTEATDAQAQSKKCTAAGKKPVTVTAFPDQNQANLAVSSGRAQLGFADTPVAAYQVKKTNGEFKLTGAAYAPAPYGLAIAKSAGSLDKAVKAALLVLMKNGTYQKIFAKWGVSSIAIKPAQVKINGAGA
jgi:polar amino acid transport system substrate-binding protein